MTCPLCGQKEHEGPCYADLKRELAGSTWEKFSNSMPDDLYWAIPKTKTDDEVRE